MPGENDRILAIESPLGDSCAVSRLSGEERINDLYSFSVCVASTTPIKPEQILGDPVTVTISNTAEKTRQIFGIVARLDQVDPIGDNLYEYDLEVVPPLWLLGLSAHTRLFEAMTTTEIATMVVSEGCGMAVEVLVTAASRPRETCMQYNESDLDFVLRLLSEDGISFFFKHDASDVTLVLTDAITGFPNCNPQSYAYRGRSSSESLLCVSAFRRSGRLATGALENFDYSEYSAPKPRSFTDRSSATSKLRPGVVQRHAAQYFERKGSGRDLNAADSKHRVRAWLEGMESDAEYFTGESSWPTLIPGHKMKLETKPVVADDTEFLILEVLHEASEGPDIDSTYSNHLRCAPVSNKAAFRPSDMGQAPRIWGVQTATVVEVRPIPGDGVHAEVKVRFPWDSEGISCWARVAQLYAGNKWGGYFVPELEQEVLVEFIGGNPDRPVVVGAVYNSNNAIPPYNKWQSGIRTRSASYNELLFTDEPGKEVFYTEAGKDYEFLVHNDQTGTVEHDRSVDVKNDDKLTVQNNREVKVSRNYDIGVESGNYSTTLDNGDFSTDVKLGKYTVDAMGAITIESKKSISLKVGGSTVKLDMMGITLEIGASKVTLQQHGVTVKGIMTEVNGSAMAKLKGGVVMIN